MEGSADRFINHFLNLAKYNLGMVFKVALITSISFEVYPFPLTVPVILNPRGLSRLQISDRFLLYFKIKSTPNPPLPPCFHKTNKQTNQPSNQTNKQKRHFWGIATVFPSPIWIFWVNKNWETQWTCWCLVNKQVPVCPLPYRYLWGLMAANKYST